jgi:hypothetical protein
LQRKSGESSKPNSGGSVLMLEAEVRARRFLRSLGGYHIEYDATVHSLDVTISNSMDAQDWAVIWVENYAGLASEDKPLPLSFDRGNKPLVLRIMSEIAKVCGPFLVVFNFDDPRLVTADGPTR